MKTVTILAAGLLCLALSTSTNAANVWSNYFTIKQVYQLGNERFLLQPDPAQSGCSYFRFYNNTNGLTTNGIKMQLANSLAAALAGQSIRVYYDNATASCYSVYSQVLY